MAFKLFGYTIIPPKGEEKSNAPSIILPQNISAASTVSSTGSGAAFNQTLLNSQDFIAFGTSEVDLINTYRSLALQPEVDEAISDIIHEMLIQDENKETVMINTDMLPRYYDKDFRDQLTLEFKSVLHMLDFHNRGYDIARQFYVDGRLYYDLVIDEKNPKNGIVELRNYDPRTIKPIREIKESTHPETGARIVEVVNEYYAYNPHGISNENLPTMGIIGANGTKIAKDRVAYVNSGVYTPGNVKCLSFIHKAIKPYNQLRMVEDATVIYRVTRAPERRVFYIDVGDIPANKIESYMQEIVNKYRSRMTYDSADGQINDTRRAQSILEDFFLPRRSATGKGTEIDTLPGGCLAMDTLVPLLDGRDLTIKEIESELAVGKELWAYSCDPITGNVVPGIISWAGVTQKSAKVMKITLDNGKEIICTLDHKFPVPEKGFVAAEDLVVGQSMFPLYKKRETLKKNKSNKLTYEMLFDNKDKTWKYTHKVVSEWKDKVGINNTLYYNSVNKNKPLAVVHHVNYNRYNNNPNNLAKMSWKDHQELHMNLAPVDPKVGSEAAKLAIEKMKLTDPIKYQEMLDRRIASQKNTITNRSTKKHLEIANKISKGVKEFIVANPSYKQKLIQQINNVSKKGNIAANAARALVIKNNPNAYKWSNKDYASRVEVAKTSLIFANTPEARAKAATKQRIVFPQIITEFVKNNTNISAIDICNQINNRQDMLNEFRTINNTTSIPNVSVLDMTPNRLNKLVIGLGYKNWRDFKNNFKFNNHKIVNIEYIEQPIEVGTLTIDRDEKYHNHHTFALSAGIFTKNSNLGEMEDVEYFKRKLYRALNIPLSRIEKDGGTFQLGRVAEIARDEIKFSRFLIRLRDRLGMIFDEILSKHLYLKEIIKSPSEWYQLRQYIRYDFISDSHFNELKEMEVLSSRLDAVAKMDPYIGRYYSDPYIRDVILKQTQAEQEEIDRSLEEYPHQIPAMILPKNADGMRPADPIAAGLFKNVDGDGNVMPSGAPNAPSGAAPPPGSGKAAAGGKSSGSDSTVAGGATGKQVGGLGSGFASGAKSGAVVTTGFKGRFAPVKKGAGRSLGRKSSSSWGSIATDTSSSGKATEEIDITGNLLTEEVDSETELAINDDGTLQIK